MMKWDWKIWLLLILIAGSVLAIFPLGAQSGVAIASVTQDSIAQEEGLREGMIVLSVDDTEVVNANDYATAISEIFPREEKVKVTINTNEGSFNLYTNMTPEVVVREIPKTRIKTGLDLSGGVRALITTEEQITNAQLQDLIAVTNERLNVFGLRDVVVRPVTDLSGNNLMLVEIAGSTPDEVVNLVTQQGEFEAKIGNETVFIGGVGDNKDITYVARTGDQSGIYNCQGGSHTGGAVCNFQFAISLSNDAAKRHADITKALGVDPANPGYLDKQLDLYLDGELVDSLFIGTSLQGSETTQISISGSGVGETQDSAFEQAEVEMKQLQTVLITGSLPFKLKIEKLDTLSPLLGQQFIGTILIAGLAAVLAVAIIIFFRYRKIKLSLAVLFTSLSEVIIIVGVSALFGRNLDLPAIAGIIAAIGTGVDSQIIILDESTQNESASMKERIKRALYIIMGTYVTTLFALMPLMWAGAGLLKGFALTTIIGISVGVFITRPAFSEMVKRIIR